MIHDAPVSPLRTRSPRRTCFVALAKLVIILAVESGILYFFTPFIMTTVNDLSEQATWVLAVSVGAGALAFYCCTQLEHYICSRRWRG